MQLKRKVSCARSSKTVKNQSLFKSKHRSGRQTSPTATEHQQSLKELIKKTFLLTKAVLFIGKVFTVVVTVASQTHVDTVSIGTLELGLIASI